MSKSKQFKKTIKNKQYDIAARLVCKVDVSEIKYDLDKKFIMYLIDENCLEAVEKILSVRSKTVKALFSKKIVQECLMHNMNSVTRAAVDMIVDDDERNHVLFDIAIENWDMDMLTQFPNCLDFLDIDDVCKYILANSGSEDISTFLYDVIGQEYTDAELKDWLTGESGYAFDSMCELLEHVLADIDDYYDLFCELEEGNWESFSAMVRDKFSDDDLRTLARENNVMQECGFGESCEDYETCRDCEACEDCGRRHVDSR